MTATHRKSLDKLKYMTNRSKGLDNVKWTADRQKNELNYIS